MFPGSTTYDRLFWANTCTDPTGRSGNCQQMCPSDFNPTQYSTTSLISSSQQPDMSSSGTSSSCLKNNTTAVDISLGAI
jgi:phospholipase C